MKARLHKATAGATAIGLLVALAGAFPAISAAQVASPVRAVFLKEYSRSNYTMNQGDVLVFENDDPFLSHGLAGGGFSSPVIPPGSTSLVRRAPFLPSGTYGFGDPANPGMASSLTVASAGSPRPADAAAPRAAIRIVTRRISRAGTIKVRARPNEISDVFLTARAGKRVLGTGSRAFLVPASRGIKIIMAPAARAKFAGRLRVEVTGAVTDIAGNRTKLRTAKTLSG